MLRSCRLEQENLGLLMMEARPDVRLDGGPMHCCIDTKRCAVDRRGSAAGRASVRPGFYLTALLAAIVVCCVVGPAEARSSHAIRITLADMIRSRQHGAESCTVLYSIRNMTRRRINEIVLTFNGQEGHYFTDKIFDVRARAALDRYHGGLKEIGDDPRTSLKGCGQFARDLIDIVQNRHGPNIKSCEVEKTPERVCVPMLKIELGAGFLENATSADEHPQEE